MFGESGPYSPQYRYIRDLEGNAQNVKNILDLVVGVRGFLQMASLKFFAFTDPDCNVSKQYNLSI